MKNAVRIALALSALALAVPASAQQQARRQFGVGVSIDHNAAFSPTVEVYVPIRISPEFRLEPSLGILSNNQGGNVGTDTRDVTIGVGAFWTKQVAAPADMYVGGRLKLNFANVKDNATGVSDSGTDVVVAAAIGGEYYLVSQFSLGLEGNLGLYQRSNVSGDDSGFFTTGLGFLRFYF